MAKSLQEFIREHKTELRAAINRELNFVPRQAGCDCPKRGTDHYHDRKHKLDSAELRLWILNDEGLYNWARSEGVDV